ncbi:MAG: cysteine desulfurase [Hyphomicrobiaceae bacterium]|nr:cysteine desulfurase [Hyphomicrobiaceae bacterium]
MTTPRTYLDFNATAPLRPEARMAMLAALDAYGNPSSVHAEGRAARALVERSREAVAALVGAHANEVFFTSGGSEANNWVLAAGWDTILVSDIEHPSVLEPVRRGRARVEALPVGAAGVVEISEVAARALKAGPSLGVAVAALQLANNETGVLQPVAELAAFARAHDLYTFTDAVQAAGRIAIDCEALDVDFLSLSAHKLGGPKGVGALIVRGDTRLGALIAGGGQERRMRAGTENVAGIAGFGAAAEAARRDLAAMHRLRALRDRLERDVLRLTPAVRIIGREAERLANTSCFALPGAEAETLVIKLDLAGIAASSGAACSSGKVAASHVLAAMGVAPDLAGAAIRISLGWASTEADVDAFVAAWSAIMRGAAPGRLGANGQRATATA